ncbi:MAG: flavodoxin reductase [Flavobacteriales bacterium]|nr:flavodoxin reductase [Flavobacteriales bacterium]HQV52469.1 flavodoxin reductase [Flavobacteriales bacterium]HQX30280.1 flavodoxin reductase [Flavobacteriales bacterium]HQX38699.1 flavodoxin reductase [Flavobacteriales bacterium]HQZ93115.1 flavodoxin reductase [Flavobacteriales bacterium]
MKMQNVKIKTIAHATHDVLRIVTEKPDGFDFVPGQATELFVDKNDWRKEGRPFTFTCLPNDHDLEFIIKTYPEHNGVTNELLKLKVGDGLIVNDVFGDIAYKGEGVFIAGGAGVTPFISILRDLQAKCELGSNKLIFANRTRKDIILEGELSQLLGKNFINILSDEEADGYAHGRITEDFIKKNHPQLNGYFYVCGPPPMMDAVVAQLTHLNVPKSSIVMEAF